MSGSSPDTELSVQFETILEIDLIKVKMRLSKPDK